MRIAYNPMSKAPLTQAPSGDYLNAITFDLPGQTIYARGQEFKGTDTTYDVFSKYTSDNAGGYNGLVPAPSYNGGSNVRFLREDGSWQVIQSNSYRPLSINNTTILDSQNDKGFNLVSNSAITLNPKKDANSNYTGEVVIDASDATQSQSGFMSAADKAKLDNMTFTPGDGFSGTLADAFTAIKVGNQSITAVAGKQMVTFVSGTGIDILLNTTDYKVTIGGLTMSGATSSADGTQGLVIQPKKGDNVAYLRGDGKWAKLSTDQVLSLTGYTKATASSSLGSTDSLNTALGKLEYKADLGVSAYNIINAAVDGDSTIENLNEILKVLEGISDTDTIKALLNKYVTISTNETIDSIKTFSKQLQFTVAQGTSPFTVTSNTLVANLNANYLENYSADTLFETLENSSALLSITIGGTNKKLTIKYAETVGNLSGGGIGTIVYQKQNGLTAYLEAPELNNMTLKYDTSKGCPYWASDADTDYRVTNTLKTDTKAFITGTLSSTTNTGTQIFDTGVYLGVSAGSLYATTFIGDLDGTASVANKLGTESVGNNSTPIYLDNGVPKECTDVKGGGGYWANVEVSETSSTDTEPTFKNIIIKNSINLGSSIVGTNAAGTSGNELLTHSSTTNIIGAFGSGTIATYLRSTGNNLYHRKGTPSSYTDHIILDEGNSSVSGGGSTWGSSITVTLGSQTATLTIPNQPDDTKVTLTNTTSNSDYRVLLSANANDTTETTTARKSTKLKFNPSTGVLTATVFKGDLNGTADVASKLGTADLGNTFQPIYLVGGTATLGTSYGNAIVGITRSGNTFTYTTIDGSTGTFNQQNTNTWRAILVNGTQLAGTGTDTYAINYAAGTGITLGTTAGSSSAANKITITNSGVISVTIGTDSNANKLAVNTNGSTTYLTIPYATKSGSLSGGAKGNIVYQSAADTTAFLANPSSSKILKFNTSTGLPEWATEATYSVVSTTSDGLAPKIITTNGEAVDSLYILASKDGVPSWYKLPSGAFKTGTVTSITLTAGTGISINSTSAITTSGSRTISNTGVISIAVGTDTNVNKLAINTGGTTSYLTVPYATLSSSLIGGAKGNIVYLAGADSTAFLANPTTNGYVLKFNTSTGLPYWAADSNSNTWRAILVNGTLIASTSTSSYALNFVNGEGTTIAGTAGSSSAANSIRVNLEAATTTTLGGIKIGYTTSGKNYKVLLDSSNNAYVNVPWTDTKVTAVGNHYTPTASGTLTASASSETAATWNSTSLITGITLNKDAAGHITGVEVSSIKMPANPNSNTKNTAGATNSTSKLFLIGALELTANPQTYSNSGVYMLSGNMFATHYYETSDQKFKTNIKSILDSDNIPTLRAFDWKDSGKHSYGFIALELEELGYNELVNTDDEGTKTVNYSAALSLTVAKLLAKIEELEKQIKELRNG